MARFAGPLRGVGNGVGSFYAWRKRGFWQQILEQLQQQADAAGASGSHAEDEALGYSQGGFSTKIHLRCEATGKPVTFLLTVGQRHEAVMFELLMEQGGVKREGPGRPRIRPNRVVGNKGYTGQPMRDYLRWRSIGAVIPRRAIESRQGTRFERELIENAIESSAPSIG